MYSDNEIGEYSEEYSEEYNPYNHDLMAMPATLHEYSTQWNLQQQPQQPQQQQKLHPGWYFQKHQQQQQQALKQQQQNQLHHTSKHLRFALLVTRFSVA